jgi:hypothetical protein
LSAGLYCHVTSEKFTDSSEEWWQAVFFLVAVMTTWNANFFYVHFFHPRTRGSAIENETQKQCNLNGLTFSLLTYITYSMNCCMLERCWKWPSTFRHAWWLVNRLLNTVWSSCLEIANIVCRLKWLLHDSHTASTIVACMVTLNHLMS